MKKWMDGRVSSAAMMFALCGVAPVAANAAFVNFGTYMEDTATGLYWLNVTETAGMSYNQVTADVGSGGSLSGWELASYGQVIQLFGDAGLPTTYVGDLSTYLLESVSLVAATGSLPECCQFTGGGWEAFYSPVGSGLSAGYVPVADVLLEGTPTPDAARSGVGPVSAGYTTSTEESGSIGALLVSSTAPSPVPEPATLTLVGLCLAGIGFMRRRKAS